MFSSRVHAFVRDPRFAPILGLIGDGARIGDREKDGVVFNRYVNIPGSVYPRLGWHTDGLRDLFYGRMPEEQLNVGLHLDRCTRSNGGLRLIPGSHRQGFWSMCFRKPYFVWHRPDPAGGLRRDRAGRPDGARRPSVAPRGAVGAGRSGEPAALDVLAVPDRPVRAEGRRQPDSGLPQGGRVAARRAHRMTRARKDGAGMRTLTWLGPLLAVVLAGCAAQEPPRPQPPPRRPPAEGPRETRGEREVPA